MLAGITQRLESQPQGRSPSLVVLMFDLLLLLQTQHKLQDVRGAAIAAGIPGLSVVHNTITTGRKRRPIVF